MIILRPAQYADLSQIEYLAEASGPMVCTLPAKRRHLLAKIERSIASFQQDVVTPGEEIYFFALEEQESGQLVGTAAINARAGFEEPFYAYRNDILVHSSRALKIHNRVHALSLTHALSDHSQLCSFFILPAFRNTNLPLLLTLGRLSFIAAHPERFSQDLMAVLPGIADKHGHSPFWEHVGRKFFGIDYNQAEYYNGTRDKTFIAELMPHHPLYVPLLHEDAQSVLGLVHHDAELQFNLLTDDGFDSEQFVEIFDAGPIVTARRTQLSSWLNHQQYTARAGLINEKSGNWLILNNHSERFAAVITKAEVTDATITVSPDVLTALDIKPDDHVHCLPLPP